MEVTDAPSQPLSPVHHARAGEGLFRKEPTFPIILHLPQAPFLITYKTNLARLCVCTTVHTCDNCAHVCMATQPPVCLPDTQAWTSCAHSLVLGNYTFIFFPAFCSK